MRRVCVALTLGIVAVVFSPAPDAFAQSSKSATGTVTALAGDSVTVKVADHDMKFAVDSTTNVEAAGAGTKARAAQRAGQPGPKLSDVVKVGQSVEVTYREANGAMHATKIRGLAGPAKAKAAAGTAADTSAKTSSGAVDSVSPTSMTISGNSGGGAKFTQTFTIDAETKVVGRGAGTAAAASGGRASVTDLVANGDHVSVSYHPTGSTLHAAEIRVTMKKAAGTKK
jgi:hypothetical protein